MGLSMCGFTEEEFVRACVRVPTREMSGRVSKNGGKKKTYRRIFRGVVCGGK